MSRTGKSCLKNCFKGRTHTDFTVSSRDRGESCPLDFCSEQMDQEAETALERPFRGQRKPISTETQLLLVTPACYSGSLRHQHKWTGPSLVKHPQSSMNSWVPSKPMVCLVYLPLRNLSAPFTPAPSCPPRHTPLAWHSPLREFSGLCTQEGTLYTPDTNSSSHSSRASRWLLLSEWNQCVSLQQQHHSHWPFPLETKHVNVFIC